MPELEAVGRLAGSGYVVRARDEAGAGLLEGRVSLRQFESGISIHATDAIEMTDLQTEVLLQPGLSVLLLLEGEIDVAFDGSAMRFSADSAPEGRIWSLTRPTAFVRKSARGRHVRKVNISVPPLWFATRAGGETLGLTDEIDRFLSAQLSVRPWNPDAGAVRKGEEILAAGDAGGMLDRLSIEQNTLSLLHDALSQFAPTSAMPTPATLGPRDVTRAHGARDLIIRHLDEDLSLPLIARKTGMSVTTLQRVFRACFGRTVMEFLRMRRLELGRHALGHDGASVAEAAHLSGYSSAANFATAFQREFGYPPSHARSRLSLGRSMNADDGT